jgi:rhodanese-related sulfurtransferase
MQRISAREARARMDDGYAYLDVRSEPEFTSGHPEGAYNVPLAFAGEHGMIENESFVADVRARFGLDARLIVGCASGVRSVTAAQKLIDAGFRDVIEQRAGMAGVRDAFGRVRERGWRDEGLPVALEALPGREYART